MRDFGPAHIIISLAGDSKPVVRAWRYSLEFIGQTRADRIQLEVVENDFPASLKPPSVPWALTPGNRVQLTYQRPGAAAPRTIACRITGADPEEGSGAKAGGRPEKMSLSLAPDQRTGPRSMLIERIRAVKVLAEHPSARRIRDRAIGFSVALPECIENDEYANIATCLRYMNAAFPPELNYGT